MYKDHDLPLLTAEEERLHFQALEAGIFQRSRNPALMSRDEQARHQAILAQCGESESVLVRHNLRLVYMLCSVYRRRGSPEHDDLVQDGVIALITAIRQFRPALNYRFSSFAYRVIQNHLVKSLERVYSSTRLSNKTMKMLQETEALYRQIETQKGIGPSMQELRSASPLPERFFSLIEPLLGSKLYQWDELDQQILESVPYTNETHAKTELSVLRETITQLVLALPPRNCLCIQLRMGMGKDKPYQLEEVASELGVSRETVRGLINEGFERLKPELIKRGLHLMLEGMLGDPTETPVPRRR